MCIRDSISTLEALAERTDELRLDALVLARGGGSREDLAVFDNEELCRLLANYPIPVVTGLGHEDDLTVADLAADHRAATPTAAIVALLPDREAERQGLAQRQSRLKDALLGESFENVSAFRIETQPFSNSLHWKRSNANARHWLKGTNCSRHYHRNAG